VKRAHKATPLTPTNTQHIEDAIKLKNVGGIYTDLLMVIADVLDTAVKGEDIYMTVGMTRNKDAVLLTITWDREKLVLSGATLRDLAEQANTLL